MSARRHRRWHWSAAWLVLRGQIVSIERRWDDTGDTLTITVLANQTDPDAWAIR